MAIAITEGQRTPGVLSPGRTLGVIGAGVMGQAILGGLLRNGLVDRTQVWAAAKSDNSCRQVAESLGISVERDYLNRLPDSEILLLCVKPTQIEAVLQKLRHARLNPETLLISIAAGPTTERLESMLGTANPWVRAMPNTPCVVGDGMTVICAGKFATAAHLDQAQRVFQAVGRCVAAEEHHFNAVTALSGSGPAYVYLILEALADAGVRVGLRRDLALTLVTQTVLGATKMVQETGRHPAALRDDVTTPAGCTIGGLLMLEDGKIRSVLARAVEEATRIAGQLGKS